NRSIFATGVFPDLGKGFFAVHNWHLKVQQYNVGLELTNQSDAALAVVGHLYIEAICLELHSIHLAYNWVVFDDSYLCHATVYDTVKLSVKQIAKETKWLADLWV